MQLEDIHTILVIDWPSREVPEMLARAGFHVVVRGGPGPQDFSAFEWNGSEVLVRRTGRAPESADLIYAFRPFTELPDIVALAAGLHAHTVWTQSGLSAAGVKDPRGCWLPHDERESARKLVESAGLHFVAEPYIVDSLGSRRPGKFGQDAAQHGNESGA